MNILLYSNTFLPSLGGLERNTATLGRTLCEQGHSVVVLTETPAGVPHDAYPFQVVRSRSLRQWSTAIRQADLVLMNGGLAARLLAVVRRHAKPYGIVYQTLCGYRREGTGLTVWLQNTLRKHLAEGALFNAFTSEYSRVEAALTRSKTYTLLNPVDDGLLCVLPSMAEGPPTAPVVLFAGRVIDGKGVFLLAEALRRLDGRLRAVARIVGDGPAVAPLSEKLQGLTTIEPVFSGRLDGAELMRAYRDACVLVVPSTTHREGNPLVIAEAISVGTPVIASDQPPMVESIGEAGATFPSGDVIALAAQIERMLTDETYSEACRRAAWDRRSLFSEAAYRGALTEILAEAGITAAERTKA